MSGYLKAYQRSLNDPEGFWSGVAQEIHWDKPFTKVLDESNKSFLQMVCR